MRDCVSREAERTCIANPAKRPGIAYPKNSSAAYFLLKKFINSSKSCLKKLNDHLGLKTDQLSSLSMKLCNKGRSAKQEKTTYIKKNQKSPESNSSRPNFSVMRNPKNPAKIAAAPPETRSYCGTREYLSFV
jgi:hypothetical protein